MRKGFELLLLLVGDVGGREEGGALVELEMDLQIGDEDEDAVAIAR